MDEKPQRTMNDIRPARPVDGVAPANSRPTSPAPAPVVTPSRPVPAQPMTPPPSQIRPKRRRRWPTVLAVVLILLALAVAAWFGYVHYFQH